MFFNYWLMQGVIKIFAKNAKTHKVYGKLKSAKSKKCKFLKGVLYKMQKQIGCFGINCQKTFARDWLPKGIGNNKALKFTVNEDNNRGQTFQN